MCQEKFQGKQWKVSHMSTSTDHSSNLSSAASTHFCVQTHKTLFKDWPGQSLGNIQAAYSQKNKNKTTVLEFL